MVDICAKTAILSGQVEGRPDPFRLAAKQGGGQGLQPRNIRISLKSNDLLSLSVQDDGIGMPARPAERHGGLGLRIMQNRAALIGATLTIQPAEPTGTRIIYAMLRPKP